MPRIFLNFFKELFNEKGTVSSKRVVGFYSFFMMCIMIIAEQFFHFVINMAAFTILFSLVCYCFGLNAYLQKQTLEAKKDVASDIINSSQDNETAKDVLQSDKPNT